jgi:predicted ATPase/DNA-binding winged helix-turn-helix (wHTH) protein
MDLASEAPAIIEFGHFGIVPHRRELLADGQPIKLGERAFDMLMALIDARGEVVSKDALMARVWPGRIVAEKNLHTQISALRTALGVERELIHTVAGRGYQFIGEVRILSASPAERAGAGSVEPEAVGPSTNLPESVSELIGRDDEFREILGLAAAHRLVTLTGAGGIGKTCLALAVARRLLSQFADGVWFAELAPLTDPGLVPVAVAATVGFELAAGAVSPERVASALRGKQLLLVLDNCEHVLDATTGMAEALLRANPAAHVIATSREPLRAEGEWVWPVPPLAVPAVDADHEDDLLRYGAVRLFVERAQAARPNFTPDRRLAAMIAAICRRLDGIPLAIELAAARAAALDIEEVAARLDDRFRLLTGGRRTALPRHQTLRATLDWSYGLLPEPERVILRRLAVFAGAFRLEAASAVAASPEVAPAEVVEGLVNLVARSLVAAEVDGRVARYRLLDTTRAYAIEKLGESGERERLVRRHAEYYRDLFEQAQSKLEARCAGEWPVDYARQLDNLRAALDWAFSPAGDASVGVALTAAAVPLWMHLSLLEECRGRVERALAALAAGASRDPCHEMKLQAALGASLIYIRNGPETGAAWTKALEVAERLDNAEYRLRSLLGLWLFHTTSSKHRIALALAERFCTLAANRPDPNDRLIGERIIGVSQHYLGDLPSARRHLERVLADYVSSDYRHIVRFQLDLRVTARVFIARILWLQGFPDQAMRAAESSVEEARAANHVLSLCYALALAACPIALSVGDLTAAESYVGSLLDHSTRHALAVWQAFGLGHQGVLAIKRGDRNTGLRLLRAGLDEFGETRFLFGYSEFRGKLARALGDADHGAEGLAVIEEALAWTERTGERSRIAELLRIKGELLRLQGAQGAAAAAEDHFRHALDCARRQGALSWELRAATSLAQLLRDQSRAADALALLQPIYDQFTEGFETADLKAAKALIDSLPLRAGARREVELTRLKSHPINADGDLIG